MTHLLLVHLREARCGVCGRVLAHAGERSFVVDRSGDAAGFEADDLPYEMVCEMICDDGHSRRFFVPNEISAEDALSTSGGVPIGRDALLLSAKLESGKDVLRNI